MSHSGLQAVSNASEMFLSEQQLDSEILAGLAVAVIMDGSRTFLIEIQVIFFCFNVSISNILSCQAHYGFSIVLNSSVLRNITTIVINCHICKQWLEMMILTEPWVQ